MIILDMDGTLLNSDRIISENAKMILKKLKKKGKTIVIATGRCLEKAIGYLSEDFVDYVLASNGATWYDIKEKIIIKENKLDKKECVDILNIYSNLISHLYVFDNSINRFENTKDAIEYINTHNDIIRTTIKLNEYKECEKVSQILKNKYNNLYIQLIQDSFNECQCIDIMAKDSNKGSNVEALAKYLHIDINKTLCFGDGLNDIEMFQHVKVSVAMGNALPELKKIATHITDKNDNDGVYKFLSDYFKMNKGE